MTRRRSRCSAIELLVWWIAILIATTARAQPSDFERHVTAAQQLYAAQDFEAAIVELESAYRLKPVRRLLFNLGMAHRRLGHALQALDYFERFRALRGPQDGDVPIDRYIAEMRIKVTSAEPPAPVTAEAPDPPLLLKVDLGDKTESPPPAVVVTAPPPSKKKPLYRRWWLWTTVGVGAAAVATAIALGVTLGGAQSGNEGPFPVWYPQR
jgi:hypothetical protein